MKNENFESIEIVKRICKNFNCETDEIIPIIQKFKNEILEIEKEINRIKSIK